MEFKSSVPRETYGIDGVEFPVGLEVIEAKGIDVLVDGQGNLNEQVHQHETFSADLEWQNFDGVGDEQAGPGERVRDREDPDEGNNRSSSSCALLGFLLRRANCPEDEGDAHAGGS